MIQSWSTRTTVSGILKPLEKDATLWTRVDYQQTFEKGEVLSFLNQSIDTVLYKGFTLVPITRSVILLVVLGKSWLSGTGIEFTFTPNYLELSQRTSCRLIGEDEDDTDWNLGKKNGAPLLDSFPLLRVIFA